MTQAGAVRMTTVATVLEFQRDWANREHYNALMNIFREHCGAYGVGIEYAYTMVHKAPAARKNLKLRSGIGKSSLRISDLKSQISNLRFHISKSQISNLKFSNCNLQTRCRRGHVTASATKIVTRSKAGRCRETLMAMVHIAVTQQVKPGCERAFEEALRDFASESLREPGMTGVYLIGPVPGTHGCEYGILRSFENEAASRRFYESDDSGEVLGTPTPLIDSNWATVSH